MNYIRTYDGKIYKHWAGFNKHNDFTGRMSYLVEVKPNQDILLDEDEVYEFGNTIEKLCDEFVYKRKTECFTNKEILPHATYKINNEEVEIYGAIWTKGVHGEPILKPAAKMKGILPNGEIDWELL